MVVQWRRVLDRALAEHEVVAVRDVVASHLGRTPTRSELTAARRAARGHAAAGDAEIGLVPILTDDQDRRTILVLARPGVDLDDPATVQGRLVTAATAERPHGRDTADSAGRAERLLTQIAQAARGGSLLPVDQLEPAHARLLADELTDAVAQLTTLTAALARRSRQPSSTPAARAGADRSGGAG